MAHTSDTSSSVKNWAIVGAIVALGYILYKPLKSLFDTLGAVGSAAGDAVNTGKHILDGTLHVASTAADIALFVPTALVDWLSHLFDGCSWSFNPMWLTGMQGSSIPIDWKTMSQAAPNTQLGYARDFTTVWGCAWFAQTIGDGPKLSPSAWLAQALQSGTGKAEAAFLAALPNVLVKSPSDTRSAIVDNLNARLQCGWSTQRLASASNPTEAQLVLLMDPAPKIISAVKTMLTIIIK